jgi:hypothetical protein
MAKMIRPVPENWYVDPLELGVPGTGNQLGDDNPLAWQADALCAQTDPEAFFPEKGGSTRAASSANRPNPLNRRSPAATHALPETPHLSGRVHAISWLAEGNPQGRVTGT